MVQNETEDSKVISSAELVKMLSKEKVTPMSFCVRELLKASMVARGEDVPLVSKLKQSENKTRMTLMRAAVKACLMGEEGSLEYGISFRHLNSCLRKECEVKGISSQVSPQEIKQIIDQAVRSGYIVRKRNHKGMRYELGNTPVPDETTEPKELKGATHVTE